MQIFAASTCVLTLLLFVSFFVHSQSVLNDHSPTQKVQPTPPGKEKIEQIATPTPTCSPTPSLEKEKYNPFDEMSLENVVDMGLGTPDFDCDGIRNFIDNCPTVYNPDQKDSNGDGKGEACDPELVGPSFIDSRCDMDGDGVPDIKDNCPAACNPDQKFVDINENEVNDLCDSVLPNFVFERSCTKRKKVKAPRPPKPTPPSQETTEKVVKPTPTFSPQHAPLAKKDPDEIIDPRVGEDSDCDGINDITDNCALNYNPNQKDSNHDGKGDACDPQLVDKSFVDMRCDGDRDGVPDNKDNCNLFCNPNQELIDVNNNKIHDACDPAIPDLSRPMRSCTKRIKVKAKPVRP